MPFVQRNWRGEIVGLFGCPQPQADGTYLTEPEPLADDHPDVLEFLSRFPSSPPSLGQQDFDRLMEDTERIKAEHEDIRVATAAFNQCFSELEIALSALLYTILNLRNSKLAYAIYYSPPGFDARRELVGNCVIQIAIENADLERLSRLWPDVDRKLDKVRRLRNAMAHGAPLTISVNGRQHARHAPPAFDVVRVGRKLQCRQIPGLTSSNIKDGRTAAIWSIEAVDHINRIIEEFHDGGPGLRDRFEKLSKHLGHN